MDQLRAAIARRLAGAGGAGPVAIDWNWRNKTLKEWWLTGPDRPATSVTFILDTSGVIQFIHPGMEYHDDGTGVHEICVNDMGRIRAAIERLIAE